MLMHNLTVKHFMSSSPHTIGHEQPLTAAHKIMREHDIRHLPVLDGGRLAGMLSQRDLYLIESLRDVDPERVNVSEAMSTEVFAVGPDTTIRTIVSEMAVHKYGSAVVVERDKVVGVFTTTDALAVFAGVLDPALDRPNKSRAARKVRAKAG
jgi:acetoin utilization protein AcuB